MRTKLEFMARVRRIPAIKLQAAMNKVAPGVIWWGCPKGRIAELWVEASDGTNHHELANVSLADIGRALAEIERLDRATGE